MYKYLQSINKESINKESINKESINFFYNISKSCNFQYSKLPFGIGR